MRRFLIGSSALVALPMALVLSVGASAPALAQDHLKPLRTDAPPVIDGVMDDAAWQAAPKVTGFKTWHPDYGIPMADDTEVYYVYDAENFYFGFRCFDSQPERIKTSVNSRDRIRADDWVGINLDSFNDQQSLYTFYVNAFGIQMDARYAAGHEDYGFDAVWYSVGRIDEKGYVVEVKIPFKSLRYRGSNPVVMSLVFERQITRRSEMGTWPSLKPGVNNWLVQTVPIEFADIKHYTLLEVLPAVTYSNQAALADAGRLETTRNRGELSLTGTYGVTSRLTLDGTVNPDFSQVESDAGQIDINLRSALFYPEKRPFFLEGNEIFNVGGPTTSDPLQAIVHTRTIVDPIGGAKLSGKLSAADTVAVLYSPDEPPVTTLEADADQYAQVGVARYKRSFREDSYVGGFFTSRSQSGSFNRVFGADGALRLNPASTMGYYGFLSQTGAAPGGEQEDGHAVGADYARDTRRLGLGFAALDISTGFQTDTGYLTRAGVTTLRAAATPRFYPRNRGFVRRVDLSLVTEHTRDQFDDIWESNNPASLRLFLPRNSSVTVSYTLSSEVYRGGEFDTSGFAASASSQITRQLSLSGSFSNRGAIYYSADPFGGASNRATFRATYLPTDNLHLELNLTYADFTKKADGERLYDYMIVRSRNTYQVNRYLFFRAIFEYNSYRRQLLTDLLASFTYVPGTVIHLGYGSVQDRIRWQDGAYVPSDDFLTSRRGIFFKASYLWRL